MILQIFSLVYTLVYVQCVYIYIYICFYVSFLYLYRLAREVGGGLCIGLIKFTDGISRFFVCVRWVLGIRLPISF